MKIAFFQDMCPYCNDGGAQLNDKGMINEGIKRGHKIEIYTPQNVNMRNLDCDLVILSNCMVFPKEYLKEVCLKFPYIFFHHDFNFFDYRLFYPMNNKHNLNRDFWLPLYLKAKLHIWLSSLHREAYLKAYPELTDFRIVTIPSAIDTKKFKPIEGVERIPNSVVGINVLEKFKGRYNIYEYAKQHPELTFNFIGQPLSINLPNCNYLGFIKQEDMPRVLSANEYIIHLPAYVEPYGRATIEGLLCGCKVITNELNGAFSYPFMKEKNIEYIKEMLNQAPIGFWEEIEKSMDVLYNKNPVEVLDESLYN